MLNDAAKSDDRERFARRQAGLPDGPLPAANYLVISGGGDDGAFGAGLLVGWTRSGQRPEFKVVTGISAGALIAPFAFLGPKYDSVLQTAFTSIRPRDIFHARNWLSMLSKDSVEDTTPLAASIKKYITREVLDEVAAEYAKGRLLLIGTTDLDAGQPVVWNMGAIASSKAPQALELFRKVLLASAAIPGLFPPVMIDVDYDGHRYEEMHVDGGVMRQVFLAPPSLVKDLIDSDGRDARQRNVYVIRNGRVEPQWIPVQRRTTVVARRALEALTENQGVNDLYRLEEDAPREREHFNVAYIDQEFTVPHLHLFASGYMRHLFDYGYDIAVQGKAWHRALPNLNDSVLTRSAPSP